MTTLSHTSQLGVMVSKKKIALSSHSRIQIGHVRWTQGDLMDVMY
jgi:hypothetical protein